MHSPIFGVFREILWCRSQSRCEAKPKNVSLSLRGIGREPTMPIFLLLIGDTSFSKVFSANKMSALIRTTISSLAFAKIRFTADALPRRFNCLIN